MKNQAGFIQNFIIPSIVLIGVVIAGIAMLASNSGGTDTSNEKASMRANSIIGAGLTVSGAIQRAEADGALPGIIINNESVLVSGKYLTAVPTLPQGQTPYGDSIQYIRGMYAVRAGASGAEELGTSAPDDVILIRLGESSDNTARLTCNRINNKIAGVASNSDDFMAQSAGDDITSHTNVAGVTEGCGYIIDGNTLHYYKVVAVK